MWNGPLVPSYLTFTALIDSSQSSNLELVDGDPGIGGEVLEHGDEELETAVPVTDEQHHADEVEDAHEHPGHAQKLKHIQVV